jgi:hypothetical protein
MRSKLMPEFSPGTSSRDPEFGVRDVRCPVEDPVAVVRRHQLHAPITDSRDCNVPHSTFPGAEFHTAIPMIRLSKTVLALRGRHSHDYQLVCPAPSAPMSIRSMPDRPSAKEEIHSFPLMIAPVPRPSVLLMGVNIHRV